MRRPLLVAALLALAVAAAGCAIPTQGSPSTISNSKVPFNLMDPHPPTTTTTQPSASSYVPVKVYFLTATDQLVAAPRVVPPPAPLIAVIRALLGGVTRSETAENLSTAIPSNVTVLSVSTQPGNIVTVNLNSAFGEISGTQHRARGRADRVDGDERGRADDRDRLRDRGAADQRADRQRLARHRACLPAPVLQPRAAGLSLVWLSESAVASRGSGASAAEERSFDRCSAGVFDVAAPRHAGCAGPQMLEVVVVPRVLQEHVRDEVAVVHEHPGGVLQALDARRRDAVRLLRLRARSPRPASVRGACSARW